MPATGTPEPDGLFYSETIDVIREVIASGRRIVGLDIVELAPDARTPHADLTTARLLYKILNLAMTPAPKRSSTKPTTRRRS
jgi:agmatinase